MTGKPVGRRDGRGLTRVPALPPKPSALSLRFLVDDLSGATITGSRLNNVLAALAERRPIHPDHKAFLRDQGAHALVDLIDGAISEVDYAERTQVERKTRQETVRQRKEEADTARHREAALASERAAALQARLKQEAEQRQAARIRYESSPEFIAKQKTREQLQKYGVTEYIEGEDFKRLLSILRKLDSGSRLQKEDVVWIKSRTRRYPLDGVLLAHHRREADVRMAEFKRGGDPWQAINASGHLRKCNASKEAVDLLVSIPAQRLKHDKLKSAMLTTQGGAMRDMERFAETLQAGEAAHKLLPRDFRPCTLLGAVHMQQGNYASGHDWYRKAEERGAPPAGIESEIHMLLRGMDEEKRRAAEAELRRLDPVRYAWIGKSSRRSGRPASHE